MGIMGAWDISHVPMRIYIRKNLYFCVFPELLTFSWELFQMISVYEYLEHYLFYPITQQYRFRPVLCQTGTHDPKESHPEPVHCH